MIKPIEIAVPPINDIAIPGKKQDIAAAARQFESLLLGQILKSVREAGTDGGWMGSGDDSGSTTAMEMAEEQFAAALSAQGGLGLARMITTNLESAAAKATVDPKIPQ